MRQHHSPYAVSKQRQNFGTQNQSLRSIKIKTPKKKTNFENENKKAHLLKTKLNNYINLPKGGPKFDVKKSKNKKVILSNLVAWKSQINELSTDLSNTQKKNRWNNSPANPNEWQVDDKYQDFLTFLIEGVAL